MRRERLEFRAETDYSAILSRDDIVVHLVSSTVPATSNISIPDELGDIEATARLLDACVRAEVGKVVFLSSGGAVYGPSDRPSLESDELLPISSYGLQKLAIEKLLALYGHQHGLPYCVIRPSNPYGPWQDPRKGQGVVAAFVHAALTGRPLRMYGDGSVVRDFIYIDDLVEGISSLLDYEGDYSVFNLGSGRGYSMRQVAEVVRAQLPCAVIERGEGRPVDVPSSVLDVSLIEREVGIRPRVGLDEGIGRVIDHQRLLLSEGRW